METSAIVGIVLGLLLVFLVIVICYLASLVPWLTYFNCRSNNVPITPSMLIGMKFRNVPIDYLIETLIKARKAGIDVGAERLEIHYLSNGNIGNVVQALISASRSNLRLDFEQAAAIDLAGRDVNQAVMMCVQPKVLKAPEIQAVAKDGIELRVKVNITVRANLRTMIGGAGEETILARVGEGIVSAIGSSEKHSTVLKSPDLITKHVMSCGLDAGTAFEIVSLDIADIDVGRNIGAFLKNAQAIADKQVAEARAEGRRATAEALTQENKAAEQEAKAKLVEAEMRVPLALAETFRSGKLIVKRSQRKASSRKLLESNLGRSGLSFGDDE